MKQKNKSWSSLGYKITAFVWQWTKLLFFQPMETWNKKPKYLIQQLNALVLWFAVFTLYEMMLLGSSCVPCIQVTLYRFY